MTRRASVFAYCRACGHDWPLDSGVANTIADELGLSGRLRRRGTSMERWGATYTPLASGRRIPRTTRRIGCSWALATVLRMAACPRCRSLDVLLAAPG